MNLAEPLFQEFIKIRPAPERDKVQPVYRSDHSLPRNLTKLHREFALTKRPAELISVAEINKFPRACPGSTGPA
ncbi:MAG: hypothetical protein KDA89_22090, partial [Planctomycetaceae bacterium]|nr:hypothetical protein [Planctomycetaceae bacterium]